jgi:hypothetical protein
VPRVTLALVALAGLAVSGCAGVALPALGAAALSGGVGSVVRAGTEYTLLGTAHRTFSVPVDDVARAVGATLERLQFTLDGARVDGVDLVVEASGIDRTVDMRLAPITPVMTRLTLVVRSSPLTRDRATITELLTRIEQHLIEQLKSTADLR